MNGLDLEYEHSKRQLPVEIIHLGEVGHFGSNMTAISLGDRILVVDAAIMFPNPENPGVDVILPNISFLAENKSRVDGVILTHGEDALEIALNRFFRKKTERRPMIIPVAMQVGR